MAEQLATGSTPLVMTPALRELEWKLEYFTKRRETSMFSSEITFYNEKIKALETEIEGLVLEQIDQ